jgi:pyrroloquinoline quinone biosynthesis protein D
MTLASAAVLSAGARPVLARGVRLRLDRISGKTLLLRPEQGFELRGSALEVIRLCDGRRSIADIVDTLAARATDTARAEIEADVLRLLSDLRRRGVIEVEPS